MYPQGTWPGRRGEVAIAHCCLLYSEFPDGQHDPSACSPVSSMYVMEAEVPHTQCLWFQVRTMGVLGLICCALPITVILLRQGPRGYDQDAGVQPGAWAMERTVTHAYLGLDFSLPLFILSLSRALSLPLRF